MELEIWNPCRKFWLSNLDVQPLWMNLWKQTNKKTTFLPWISNSQILIFRWQNYISVIFFKIIYTHTGIQWVERNCSFLQYFLYLEWNFLKYSENKLSLLQQQWPLGLIKAGYKMFCILSLFRQLTCVVRVLFCASAAMCQCHVAFTIMPWINHGSVAAWWPPWGRCTGISS